MTTPAAGGGAGFVSPLIRQPVSGLFTVSDFESKSHEELRAMVEHASPAAAEGLSSKLKAAAEAINKIAEDLKAHVAHVEWEGEGGEAFRTWGADMANATLRLGEFSAGAGTWMGHAAGTLAHVQSAMPAVSTASRTTLAAYRTANPGQVGAVAPPLAAADDRSGGLQGRGPTQQEAYAAQQRLDADRAEAARLMRQLAGSYAWSAHNMQGVGRPAFPAPPTVVLPPEARDGGVYIPAPGAAGRTDPGRVPVGMAPSAGSGGSDGGPSAGRAGEVSSGPHGGMAPVDRPDAGPVHMGVDGGTAVPRVSASQPSSSPVTAPSRANGTEGNVMPLPTPSVLPTRPAGRATTGPGRGAPSVELPRSGNLPSGPGRGTIGGRLNVPISNVPTDGIIGGRPAPRMSGQSPMPRGTVIGAEPGQSHSLQGPQAGYAPAHGAAPGASAGRAGGGAAGGRRLAVERGGVVGGRVSQRSGASGDEPFTQGGLGLVRPAGEASRERSKNVSRQGRRPDYLVEDEESWTQGNRRTVPPVVD